MSDETKDQVTELTTSIARDLIGRIVDERRDERDKLIKKGNRSTNAGAILSLLIGAVLFWMNYQSTKLSEGNRELLESIKLRQENSVLTERADADKRFVSRDDWQKSDYFLKQANVTLVNSVEKLSDAVAALKTDVAVIKSQTAQQAKPTYHP